MLQLLVLNFLFVQGKGMLDKDLDRVWALRESDEMEYVAGVALVLELADKVYKDFVNLQHLRSTRKQTYARTGRVIRMATSIQALLLATNLHKRWCHG